MHLHYVAFPRRGALPEQGHAAAEAARLARRPLKGAPRGKGQINIVGAIAERSPCSRSGPSVGGLRWLRAEPAEIAAAADNPVAS